MRNKTLEQQIYKAIRDSETDTKDKDYQGLTKDEIITQLCIEQGVTADEVKTALKWLEDNKQVAMSVTKFYAMKNGKNICIAMARVYNTREYLDKDYFDVNGMADTNETKKGVNSMNADRLKVLLYNALDMLKNAYNIDDTLVSVEDTDLLDELGMTQEEYDEILKGE